MPKNLPPKEDFIGKKISQRYPNHEITEHIASGNNGHLFLAVDRSINSQYAFKVVPEINLTEKYLDEARKANDLENRSVVKCHDVFQYSKMNCVVFVFEYVKGKNLRDYMKKNKSEINIPFTESFLQTMFGLLYELDVRKYQHGDLHAGNILVAKSEYDISGEYAFRVTDFGVRKADEQTAHETDYLSVSHILKQLLACVNYSGCEGRDRYIYDILKNDFLKRHLIETDPTADPLACNAQKLLEKLQSLDAEYKIAKTNSQNSTSTLNTPFDYPSCEQIGNDHSLLQSLYSENLLGLTEIEKKSNLMLTGPRGCGKTTVFRALSLEYLMSVNMDRPNNLKSYIGIYYRCDDLYFSFPRYKFPEREEAFNIPMHFLTVTLLAISLEQIKIWAEKHCANEFKNKEHTFVAKLWTIFELKPPDDPSANKLASLINKLKKERKRATEKQRFAHTNDPIKGYFGPEVTLNIFRFIRETLTFLDNRPFYFFIDDYSNPKITKDLQANLNRLLMHRGPDVFFKLSTDSPISFARYDIDEKQFTENREYDLLNLGLRYIQNSSPESTLKFFEDLFNRRFSTAREFPVTSLKELLGPKQRNENAMARVIKEEKSDDYYAGMEIIAAMCSGDIHYMIKLVARMVEDNGGNQSLKNSRKIPRIPYKKQHTSIRAEAGAFMESIRVLPGKGPKLMEVINAFGNVAHSYLMHKTSSNEGRINLHQASRIEPYEVLKLTDEAQEMLDELLRYSVLIEDPRGRSRRGQVVPRFYLRRYLIPYFRLTFSKRDSIQLENEQIIKLLCDPNKFESEMKLKKAEDANQGDIFDNE